MHLNVVTTLRCDFRCAHCLLGCPSAEDLDPDTFCSALDTLVPLGLRSLTFTGGEARLHPAFHRLVEEAATRGLSFGIVSNAWEHEAYGAAADRHPGRFTGFHFSLDGPEALHDRMRRPGSHRRVEEAIRHYRGLGHPVEVNLLLTDAALPHLPAVVARCAELGVTGIKVAGMIPVPGGPVLSDFGRLQATESLAWLSRRHRVSLRPASSLLGPDAVSFCPVLTGGTLTLTSSGAFSFCCDVPGAGAEVGRVGEAAREILVRMERTANEMVLHRILAVRAGGLGLDDRWCLYCQRFFAPSPHEA